MPSYPRWRGPPLLFPDLFSFMLISEYHPLPRKTDLMTEKDFALLVREHKSTIYTVCHMFASDQDEVNDLFQDTLINLWRGYDSFKGQSKLNSWIYRVALNTCISADRKKKRRKTIPLSMDINLFEDNDADSRQVQMLRNRIARLGPFDRHSQNSYSISRFTRAKLRLSMISFCRASVTQLAAFMRITL